MGKSRSLRISEPKKYLFWKDFHIETSIKLLLAFRSVVLIEKKTIFIGLLIFFQDRFLCKINRFIVLRRF